MRREHRLIRRLMCLRVPAINLRGREVIAILFTLGVIAIGSALTLSETVDAPSIRDREPEIARSR